MQYDFSAFRGSHTFVKYTKFHALRWRHVIDVYVAQGWPDTPGHPEIRKHIQSLPEPMYVIDRYVPDELKLINEPSLK